jgi:hypothetical protein
LFDELFLVSVEKRSFVFMPVQGISVVGFYKEKDLAALQVWAILSDF